MSVDQRDAQIKRAQREANRALSKTANELRLTALVAGFALGVVVTSVAWWLS